MRFSKQREKKKKEREKKERKVYKYNRERALYTIVVEKKKNTQ